MALVKPGEEKVGSEGRKYWTFRLIVEVDGMPLESTGWKYFPATGAVKPPAVKIGVKWIPTFAAVGEEILARVRKAIQKALEGPGRVDPAEGPGERAVGAVMATEPDATAREWLLGSSSKRSKFKTALEDVVDQAKLAIQTGREEEYLDANWGDDSCQAAARWVLEMKRAGREIRL